MCGCVDAGCEDDETTYLGTGDGMLERSSAAHVSGHIGAERCGAEVIGSSTWWDAIVRCSCPH